MHRMARNSDQPFEGLIHLNEQSKGDRKRSGGDETLAVSRPRTRAARNEIMPAASWMASLECSSRQFSGTRWLSHKPISAPAMTQTKALLATRKGIIDADGGAWRPRYDLPRCRSWSSRPLAPPPNHDSRENTSCATDVHLGHYPGLKRSARLPCQGKPAMSAGFCRPR